MSLGIYIHIPFCLSRCNYCHFVTGSYPEETMVRYGTALRLELEQAAGGGGTPDVDSIYFGGGTPSLVPVSLIAGVLSTIKGSFPMSGDCEISLEANPETISAEKSHAYRLLGINRISLGVQSFVDAELKSIERRHGAGTSGESLRILREAGFTNLNLDLILGLPGQTVSSWRSSLEKTVEASPSHVSVYMLDLDDARAPLHHSVALGHYSLPDDDEQAEWYLETIDRLKRHGIVQYEISNFATDGRACRHNLKYWTRQPVLGFGLGSHSYDGCARFANVSGMDNYLNLVEGGRSPVEWRYPVDEISSIEESLFLGLRLNRGVDLQSMRDGFGSEKLGWFESSLRELSESGLLEAEGGFVRLTPRGRLLANDVFSALLQ